MYVLMYGPLQFTSLVIRCCLSKASWESTQKYIKKYIKVPLLRGSARVYQALQVNVNTSKSLIFE